MKLSLKDVPAKLQPLFAKVRRYIVPIYCIALSILFGFLVVRIGLLAQAEPDEQAVSEKLKGVKRPRIDQNAIDKIQALQSSNVEVEALFKQARENPFQE